MIRFVGIAKLKSFCIIVALGGVLDADMSCFFALFVGIDLVAAFSPTQEGIEGCLDRIVGTSLDLTFNPNMVIYQLIK